MQRECDQSGRYDRGGSQSAQATLGREPIISRLIAPADAEGWGRSRKQKCERDVG